MKKRVYLDYAAAAPLREEVIEAMRPYLADNFANPSALYREADLTRQALEDSREKIARAAGVKVHEVIFVSSSTEANNLAIFGVARAGDRRRMSITKPGRIITTAIEHPSILEPLAALEREGWKITRLPVTSEGFIDLEELKRGVGLPFGSPTPKLVTLAWANPDIGVIQPVRELVKDIDDSIVVHLDGSQAGGFLDINIPALGADLFTISSSKIYGPRGIAALVVRSPLKLEPLIRGGGQERELRSGTENVAAAVGFARAVELAAKEQAKETARLSELRNMLLETIPREVPDVLVTGPALETIKKSKTPPRLANHASFAFGDIEGEELAVRLDEVGFAVGTGSACAARKDEISMAVGALGLPGEYEKGTLRVTLGKETTREEVDDFIVALKETVKKMRSNAGL